MGQVKRLRPKRHDVVTESIRLILDLPLELSQEVRRGLSDCLGRFAPPEAWGFVMLNPEQQRAVIKAINAGEKPGVTIRVWNIAISYIRYDTGEIMAGRHRIAQDAETTPQEASRALTRLTDIGALIRLRPGSYAINPHVGWQGSLLKRQAVAKKTPVLVVNN